MRLRFVRLGVPLAWLLVSCGGQEATPVPPESDVVACGDGNVDALEEGCDDGNTTAGDGCNASCGVEAGHECIHAVGCRPVCGDGLIVAPELCDPGLTGDSYCSADCGAFEGSCGDGIVQADHGETCDLPVDVPSGSGGTGSGGTASGGVGSGGDALGGMGGEAPVVPEVPVVPDEPPPDISGGVEGCTTTCRVSPGYVCDGVANTCQQTGVERSELVRDHVPELCAFLSGLFGGEGNVFSCEYMGESYNIEVYSLDECIQNATGTFNDTCTIGDYEAYALGKSRCEIFFTDTTMCRVP